VTIDSLLESGHGLSHESAHDGCIGICVKLEASKNPHEVKCGMFMGSTGLDFNRNNSAINQLSVYCLL